MKTALMHISTLLNQSIVVKHFSRYWISIAEALLIRAELQSKFQVLVCAAQCVYVIILNFTTVVRTGVSCMYT